MQYLKCIIYLRMIHGTIKVNDPSYRLTRYKNSNYTRDPEDHKSLIGYYFFINSGIVSWCSKKQRTVFISITKTKYITLSYATQKNVWIRQFFNKLKITDLIDAFVFHKDNKTSIKLITNVESQSKTKYINVQHYYIRELVAHSKLVVK